jgi:GMP reductase
MTTIIEDVKLDFSDVLLMPKRSTLDSRSKVDITRTFKFKHSSVQYKGTPIIAANMDHVGTMEMARAFNPYNMAVALHKFYTETELKDYFCSVEQNPHTFFTIGTHADDYAKFLCVQEWCKSIDKPIQYLCIDIANGYSRLLTKRVEQVRREHPDIVIMAGNVVTGDMVYDLLERGADIVKVGIGPGSVCTTRRITGVGYQQCLNVKTLHMEQVD